MAYNFVKANENLDVHGMTIRKIIIEADKLTFDEFMEYVILKQDEDVRTAIHPIVPLVLGINIEINLLDKSDDSGVNQ
jgi:hypothetical protein